MRETTPTDDTYELRLTLYGTSLDELEKDARAALTLIEQAKSARARRSSAAGTDVVPRTPAPWAVAGLQHELPGIQIRPAGSCPPDAP
jgi:cytochrome c-type biogenesis protein CcmH/NrfG